MAILQTTINFFPRGRSVFELTPNPPTSTALVDSYTMRLWVLDQLVYEQIQSVRNWQMRHYDDAIRFGTQLRDEIQAAEARRTALGIPDYDESYWGDEEGPTEN